MTEVILPIEPSYNEYGALIFKDHNGKDWKINKGTAEATQEKRKVMMQTILDAAADKKYVSLTMASYQGKPYIDEVELANEALEEKVAEIQETVRDPRPTDQKPLQSGGRDAAIARAVALKAAVELCAAGKIELNKIGAYARKFEEYLATGM